MMLLPSPFQCDQRASQRPQLPRLGQYSRARSFCPASTAPLLHSQVPAPPPRGTTIRSTCRALHSLLGVQPPLSNLNKQAHVHKDVASPLQTSSRVQRQAPLPPRGNKKRLRDALERDNDDQRTSLDQENIDVLELPATPKRQRRAPPSIPFGLERSDFYDLPQTPAAAPSLPSPTLAELSISGMPTARLVKPAEQPITTTLNDVPEESEWDVEDDRALVGLVLEKMQLSRRAWDECARILGADQKSLGKRWQYLADMGQIGLKIRREGKQHRPNLTGIGAS